MAHARRMFRMRSFHLGLAALTAALIASSAGAAPAVTGDYVESRSANVYVGACHYEGELLTAGRNAVLAWNVTGGEFQGVSLKGIRAVAVVAGDKHLGFADAKRRSVLYVSQDSSAGQREAITALLKERAGKALGDVLAIKVAPIRFESKSDLYLVDVVGAASMKIKKQTAELCCKQPYEVWGKPFVPVKDAKTGYCLGVNF